MHGEVAFELLSEIDKKQDSIPLGYEVYLLSLCCPPFTCSQLIICINEWSCVKIVVVVHGKTNLLDCQQAC